MSTKRIIVEAPLRVGLALCVLCVLCVLCGPSCGPAWAEVNSAVDHVAYDGNGATKAFTFAFGIFSTTELRVVCRTTATGAESVQTLNVAFTVADNDGDGDYTDGTPGGTVTFTAAPASGVEVHISRLVPLTQTSDIDGTRVVRLGTIEDAIDKLVYQTQFLRGLLYRVPMIAETERQVYDMNLPVFTGTAGYLYQNSDGEMVRANPTVAADANLTTAWSAVLEGDADGAERIEAKEDLGVDHVFDVRDYGASGDGETDDAAAIQAAIDAAQAAGATTIFFPYTPDGYRIDSALVIPDATPPLHCAGTHWYGAKIIAGSAMDAIFDFTLTGTTSQQYYTFTDLWLDCNDVADYGIYNDDGPYTLVRDCRITNAAVSGIYLQDAWDSRIENTIVTSGVNGIELGKACHGALISACSIYGNSGVGVYLNSVGGSSSGIVIDGATVIQDNDITGLYAYYVYGLVIRDVYLETNGSTGWAITVPEAMTIKANAILNGVIEASGLVATNPCRSVIFDGGYSYSVADANAALWVGSCYDLSVRNVYEARSAVPILAKYGSHSTGRIDGLEMVGNYTDGNDIEVQGGLGTASTDDKYAHTWRTDRRVAANYMPVNLLGWDESGSAGSTRTLSTGLYRGFPIWDLYDADGTSNYYQATFTVADYPEWTPGTLLWFGVWYQYTGEDMEICLKTPNGDDQSGHVTGDGTWLFRSRLYRVDDNDTTLTFGIRKIGNTDAHLYLACPMLAIAGSPYDGFEAPALDRDQVYVDTIDLSNAQIKDLADTAVELVAAPGAGKWLEFCGASLWLDYGSNALAEPSSPDNLAIEYNSGTGPAASAEITASGFITATADTGAFSVPASVAGVAATSVVNKNLALVNTGTDYTGNAGNDTVIRVIVRYRIHSGLGL